LNVESGDEVFRKKNQKNHPSYVEGLNVESGDEVFRKKNHPSYVEGLNVESGDKVFRKLKLKADVINEELREVNSPIYLKEGTTVFKSNYFEEGER
jgi:hypothetical protein